MPSYSSLELEVLQQMQGRPSDKAASDAVCDAHELSYLLAGAIRNPTPDTPARVRLLAGRQLKALIIICACYDVNLTDGLAGVLK